MIFRILVILLFSLFSNNVMGNPPAKLSAEESLKRAQDLLEQGNYNLALDEVNTVLRSKATAVEISSHACGLKGNLLLLMNDFSAAKQDDRKAIEDNCKFILKNCKGKLKAELYLLKAFESSNDNHLKAGYANSLGVLYHKNDKPIKSKEYFDTALELAENNQLLVLKIKLNQVRSKPQSNDLSFLESLLSEIANIDSAIERTRYYLNLSKTAKTSGSKAFQMAQNALQKAGLDVPKAYKQCLDQLELEINEYASRLPEQISEITNVDSPIEKTHHYLNLAKTAKTSGSKAFRLAQNALEKARLDALSISDKFLQLEILNSLADLYEKQCHDQLALELSKQASQLTEVVNADDIMYEIEWRKGRIYQLEGLFDYALTAFGKAVDHLQTIRMDIPIEYNDGKSLFRETTEPIYLGYANLLLKEATNQKDKSKKQVLLQLARRSIEQIKQTELEAFLGERCLVEGVKHKTLEAIEEKTAVIYPIILPDRLELLVGTHNSIDQYPPVRVSKEKIRHAAESISKKLRDPNLAKMNDQSYKISAQDLYKWIIAPIEPDLIKKSIDTLVFIPDGVLRLVPFAALFDGQQFLIQKYAISISPGMSLLRHSNKNKRNRNYRALLAGIRKPGSVVEKLPDEYLKLISPTTYYLRNTEDTMKRSAYMEDIRLRLRLKNVTTEMDYLQNTLENKKLFDEGFSKDNLKQKITDDSYGIIHIASHGFFSSDANNSFIMAYEDILRLNDFKLFLEQNKDTRGSIQLLALSACQTAEGDDRAPLGFTSIALQGGVLSVLGTLWPIADHAAPHLMAEFYRNLLKHKSKAESLREAQRKLLKNADMHHPFFWAPFILVGDWL